MIQYMGSQQELASPAVSTLEMVIAAKAQTHTGTRIDLVKAYERGYATGLFKVCSSWFGTAPSSKSIQA